MSKKYNIIYADPPWTFKTYSAKGKEKKSAENHYDCMDIVEIYNLPVENIADDNCALFLWVTNPMLKQGLETIEQWGFEYKTVAFSWYKRNKIADSWFWGLGYYTRANTEMCLLATKGSISRVSRSVHQIVETIYTEQIDERVGRHSQKPDVVADKIVDLLGDIPRIELFARKPRVGWDVWGSEVHSDVQLGEQNG